MHDDYIARAGAMPLNAPRPFLAWMQVAENIDLGIDVWRQTGEDAEMTAWCIQWLMPWRTHQALKTESLLKSISDGLRGTR